jgi:hypothetical protein
MKKHSLFILALIAILLPILPGEINLSADTGCATLLIEKEQEKNFFFGNTCGIQFGLWDALSAGIQFDSSLPNISIPEAQVP